jgi:hypothetical protein
MILLKTQTYRRASVPDTWGRHAAKHSETYLYTQWWFLFIPVFTTRIPLKSTL